MTYLLLATLFGGTTFILIKLLSAKLHPVLGNAITLLVALILQSAILIYLKIRGTNIFITSEGVRLGILGGVSVGLYTAFLFLTLSRFEIIKALPFIYIGAIILSLLFGVIFLKEPFGWLNFLGMLLAFSGIVLMFWK